MKAKNANMGRPPIFESPEQMQAIIDAYFKVCEGRQLTGEDGQPILNKWGKPVIIGETPPTVTGLALALGFSTRLSLIQYQGKKDFINTVTRAKTRVEEYAEGRLFDRDGAVGAKFSLANNFTGWSEKQTTELSGRNGGPIKTESAVRIYLPENGRGK